MIGAATSSSDILPTRRFVDQKMMTVRIEQGCYLVLAPACGKAAACQFAELPDRCSAGLLVRLRLEAVLMRVIWDKA